MNTLSYILLFTALFDILFAFVIFFKARNTERDLALHYLILFVVIGVWELSMWAAFFVHLEPTLDFMIHASSYALGIMSFFHLLLFVWVLSGKQYLSRTLMMSLGGIVYLMAILVFIPDVVILNNGASRTQSVPGPLMGLFYVMLIPMFLGIVYVAIRGIRSSQDQLAKKRMQLIGAGVIVVVCSNTFSSVVLPYYYKIVRSEILFADSGWVSIQQMISVILLSILSFVTAYTITRYRFMNVKIELKQRHVYAITLGLVSVCIMVVGYIYGTQYQEQLVSLPSMFRGVDFLLISTVVSILFALYIGVIVLKSKGCKIIRHSFFAVALSTSLWIGIMWWSLVTYDLLVIRAVVAVTAIWSYSIFRFILHFTGKANRKILFGVGVCSILFCALALSPYVFTGMMITDGTPHPIPGAGLPFFAVYWLGLDLVSYGILVRFIKQADKGVERERGIVISTGFIITMVTVLMTTFIVVNLFSTSAYIPVGMLSTTVFLAATAYAIMRYRFMNIKIELKQRLVYSVVIGFVFMLLIVLGEIGIATFGTITSISLIIILSFFYFTFLDKRVRFFLDSVFFLEKLDPSKAFTYDERKFDSYKVFKPWIKMWRERFDQHNVQLIGIYLLQRQHNRVTNPQSNKHIWLESELAQELLKKGTGLYAVADLDATIPRRMSAATAVHVSTHHNLLKGICFITTADGSLHDLEELTQMLAVESRHQVQYYESVEGAKRTVKELIYKGD